MLAGLFADYAKPSADVLSADASDPSTPYSYPAPELRDVPQLEDPHLPNLVVRVDVTPRFVTVGDQMTVTLRVENVAPDPATNLVVTLPLPQGALRLTGQSDQSFTSANTSAKSSGGASSSSGTTNSLLPPASPTSALSPSVPPNPTASLTPDPSPSPDPGGWTWQVPQLDGWSVITQTATMQIVSEPSGGAVLARAQVIANGLASAAQYTRGAIVVQPGRGPATAQFTPGQPALLTSYDNHVRVSIPADAATRPLTLTHSFDPELGRSPAPARAGFWRGFGAFYLSALDDTGAEVHQFARPITITVDYTPEQVQALGLNGGDLTLFWFDRDADGGLGQWVPMPTTLDEVAHTASTSVDHFSPWELSEGASPSDAFVPSLLGGQVDLQKGSFSYSYPIEVPAGPNGVRPYLSLDYHSDEHDNRFGERPNLQSSWVGKGWSLSPAYIALNKQDPHPDKSRFYTLVLNGESFDLMRGVCRPGKTCTPGNGAHLRNPSLWEWHTADQTFMKVRAEVNTAPPPTPRGGTKNGVPYSRYKWQVWAKDGTRYEFDEDAWQGWYAPTGYNEDVYSYLETYKWYLTRIEDTHGNRINYNYGDGTNGNGRLWGTCSISIGGVSGTVQRDVWPTSITWGSNANVAGSWDRYKVDLESWSRGTLDSTPDVPDNMCGPSPAQTRKLKYITVYTNSFTNPPGAWSQVRRYGLFYRGEDPQDPHNNDPAWYLLSDSSVSTCNPTCTYSPDLNTKKLTLLRVVPWGSSTSALPQTTFEYFYSAQRGSGWFPNGGWNRLQYVDNGKGGRIELQYQEIGGAPGNGSSNFLNNHRVTQKTVYDAYGQSWGHTYVWTYDYHDSEAYNSRSGPRHSYPTSASVWYNRYGSSPFVKLVHREDREFRGHGHVTEHNPNGHETEHWFNQGNASTNCTPPQGGDLFNDPCFNLLLTGESLKGKPSRSVSYEGLASGGTQAQLSEKLYAYTVPPSTRLYPTVSADDRMSGIWTSFQYTSQVQDVTWKSGASTPKITEYVYDTNFGNMSSMVLKDNTGAVVRATEYRYITRNTLDSGGTTYMVDRKYAEDVKDALGTGNWLGRTLYGYDGFNPGVDLGTTGDLRLVRQIYNISLEAPSPTLPSTVYTVDGTYTYDTYGNRLTETSYAGRGSGSNLNDPNPSNWTWSAAGGADGTPVPRTTTTTYDSTFKDLPTQVQQPLVTGQSQPLTESFTYDPALRVQTHYTDYNGNVTQTEYDTFGRPVKTVKPGDTLSSPTVWAYYSDYEVPVKYKLELKENEDGGTRRFRRVYQFYNGMGQHIQTKSQSNRNGSYDGTQSIVEDTEYDGLGQAKRQSQPRYENQTGAAFEAYLPINTPGLNIYWTVTEYDGLGRTKKITPPDNHFTTISYAVTGGMLSESTVDANNHKTERLSDTLGRLRQVVEYSGTDPWQTYGNTYYAYNRVDNLKEVRDTKNITTTMEYDSLGRKIEMTDPTMGTWHYDYYVSGNLKTQTDNATPPQTITFTYDELDRLKRKDFPGGAYTWYVYDGMGMPTAQNPKGQRTAMERYAPGGVLTSRVEWQYTNRGMMGSETYMVQDLPYIRAFSWEYDSADRLKKITYPSNEQVTYAYDPAWREKSVCSNMYGNICYAQVDPYGPDPLGYNALGQPTQYKLGNDLWQLYTYTTPMKRLQRVQVVPAAGGPAQYDFEYTTYDNVGNITRVTNLLTGQLHDYVYDHRDRLTSWTPSGAPSESYGYDEIGNLLQKGSTSYTYNYNASYGYGGPYAVRNTGFSYDANGNTLADGSERSFTWNVENLPTSISYGGKTWQSDQYSYDADGDRLKKLSAIGETETYTFYLGDLYEEEWPSGKARYYYTFNGQIVAQREVTTLSTLVYLHRDRLGSVVMVSNASGFVVGSQEFDPWGSVRTGGTVTQTKLNYTGQQLDGSGLLDYNARVYDPGLGRFPSADNLVPGGSPALSVGYNETALLGSANGSRLGSGPRTPQALGRYSYAFGNPIARTDPTGHASPMPDVYIPPRIPPEDLVDPTNPVSPAPSLCLLCQAFTGSSAGSTIVPWAGPPPPLWPPQGGITRCTGRVYFRERGGLNVDITAVMTCNYQVGALAVIVYGTFTRDLLTYPPTPPLPVAYEFWCANLGNLPGVRPCGEDRATLIQGDRFRAPWGGTLIASAVFLGFDLYGQPLAGVPAPQSGVVIHLP